MTRGNPASRFAYDPAVLVAFLDHYTTYEKDGHPARRVRLLNGHRVQLNTDARIIRRWRSGQTSGVTRAAAERLLTKFGLTTAQLHAFHPHPILRGEV